LLIFFLPCVSQLTIVFNLLTVIPRHYALIFLGVLLGQLFMLLNLHRLLPRRQTGSHYLSELKPLHLPEPGKALAAVLTYTRWYLRAICPFIVGISLLLFLSDAAGLLDLLKELLAPFTAVFLNLPEAFTDSLILGLFRKDLGAVALYDLANNGMLNSIQVLVACLFITLSPPCLGFVSELGRQRGWRQALFIFVLSTVYAFAVAALVNKILRI
jgi:ferrous iron transport protein B